jgi:DNA-binding transcriptional MerR regulator
MNEMMSVEQLAEAVNDWCDEHGISPASGQAGERMTVRNIRYYRTLGMIDPPAVGGGQGFGEKHRLQLVAVRLLQAQGLPLGRIQELLFGRSIEALKQIEKKGLAEMEAAGFNGFRPALNESWSVAALNEEFMLVSRRGRRLSPEVRERLLGILEQKEAKQEAPFTGARKRSNP